jgi:hypothetical protein
MKFRCYACGLEFRNGLPPLEALSVEQYRHEFHHDVLVGTAFEGMSPYGFCAFCLSVIRDFPLAMEDKNDLPGHHMVFTEHNLTCECGWFMCYPIPQDWNWKNVLRNRSMNMHVIEILYGDADINNLNNLIGKEI